ncbi:ATP-binding protein [Streptomyces sp. NPDC056716]|uniref:ATP-binding protein n=1 Tax=unclassified Streptomyces TaxID=2593676 RepID=UPI003692F982
MPEQSTRRQYPTRPESVAQVRAQVRELLASRGIDPHGNESAQNAVLVASELAGNAVCHASSSGSYSVTLELHGSILAISVRDTETATPPQWPTISDADATTGRGMFLVDALARDWGCAHKGAGKVVWAELLIENERR